MDILERVSEVGPGIFGGFWDFFEEVWVGEGCDQRGIIFCRDFLGF